MMERLCPILGRTTQVERTRFSREPWTVVRCRESGFVFLADPPGYSELADRFAWEVTWQEETKRRQSRGVVARGASSLSRRLRALLFARRNKVSRLARSAVAHMEPSRDLRFLDVGCADGRTMQGIYDRFAARGRRIIPVGIEVSKHLAEVSASRFAKLGGRVIASNAIDALDALDEGGVDVVLLSSFLEHEYQPLVVLQKIHRVLAPDGAVVIKVPNLACWNRILKRTGWSGFRYPDHVNYFTPRTLRILANEARFRVVRQNLLDTFPLSDSMYAVLRKKG